MTFRCMMADPPWQAKDQLPGKRGASKKYETLSTDDICAFALPVMLAPSVLFLWRIASMQEDAFRVARAWGYAVKAEVVWCKTRPCKRCKGTGEERQRLAPNLVAALGQCESCGGRGWFPHFGMGHHTRGAHETCLICTRGSGLSKLRLSASIPSVIFAPPPTIEAVTKAGNPTRKVEHSAKPEAMVDLIEALYPGPYVEMFGRRKRKGWTVRGLESSKRRRVR